MLWDHLQAEVPGDLKRFCAPNFPMRNPHLTGGDKSPFWCKLSKSYYADRPLQVVTGLSVEVVTGLEVW